MLLPTALPVAVKVTLVVALLGMVPRLQVMVSAAVVHVPLATMLDTVRIAGICRMSTVDVEGLGPALLTVAVTVVDCVRSMAGKPPLNATSTSAISAE